jgi:hypothetical protein
VNYGFEEPPSRLSIVVGIVFGAMIGIVAGFLAFLLAMALAGMIADALPRLAGPPAIAVYVAFFCLPTWAFGAVVRSRRATVGARTMAGVGFVLLALLTVGEFTGTVSVYPHHAHFYVVPGPYEHR